MSWQHDIENIIFTITTGDGIKYYPKWRNAIKDVDYNSSVFEFINVGGSLVIREQPKGRKFELKFYFDGENAVTIGNNFELSARNKNAWIVEHPFYGTFKCQPISLKQDNTNYNVSEFTVPVVETLSDYYPQFVKIVEDEISSQLETVNETQAQVLENSLELDKIELAENVTYLNNTLSETIKVSDELNEFKSLVSDAVIEISNAISTGYSILQYIQAIINYPATVEQTIEAKVTALQEALNGIIDSFDGNKNQFEAIGGSIVSSMLYASSVADYETRIDVVKIQDKLTDSYNDYITYLDSLQTDRADSDNSYIPDYSGMNEINTLYNLTIANLFDIAFEAKQEREYILDKDSNLILLTHKFYGLDSEDENIDFFIRTNDIKLNEMLNIKKGRKIAYYV